MATFMQWRRRRPDESDDIAIWNVLTPTRLVLTTGSQLDFALYVDDWWRHNYRRQPGVAEYEVIGAEDEDLWETVFRPVTDVNRHKVVCIYDGHAIDNKDAGKFEGFLGRDDLKNSHLVIREHVDGKVDSMQAKYRPFIGRKNAKFITCSPLSIKDQVELVNIELGVTGTLAKYFVEFCGSDKAVLRSIKQMKLIGLKPTNRVHIQQFAVREYGDVLADLILKRKTKEALILAESGKVNIMLFIHSMAHKMMELIRFIYVYENKKFWGKKDLAYQAHVQIWRIDELFALKKIYTINKLRSLSDLFGLFCKYHDAPEALSWFICMWR